LLENVLGVSALHFHHHLVYITNLEQTNLHTCACVCVYTYMHHNFAQSGQLKQRALYLSWQKQYCRRNGSFKDCISYEYTYVYLILSQGVQRALYLSWQKRYCRRKGSFKDCLSYEYTYMYLIFAQSGHRHSRMRLYLSW